MPTKRRIKRTLAADAWMFARGDMKEAVPVFKAWLREQRLTCSNHARFIRRWGIQRAVSFHLEDDKHTGSPRRLSAAHVEEALQGLLEGEQKGDTREAWASFAEYCRKSAVAADVLAGSGVTEKHLLRALKAALPTLKRVRIEVRVFLSPETKQARVDAAKELLEKPKEWFDATVWADAKVLYVCPKSRKAWVDTATFDENDTVVEDKRAAAKGKQLIKLKLYLAVNSLVGAVHLVYVTGTTGLRADRVDPPYTVSGACCSGLNGASGVGLRSAHL